MGMQPIVGYNFGAQKHDRVKQTLKLSILTGVCITSSGFLICELFPYAVSAIFTNDQELIDQYFPFTYPATLIFTSRSDLLPPLYRIGWYLDQYAGG